MPGDPRSHEIILEQREIHVVIPQIDHHRAEGQFRVSVEPVLVAFSVTGPATAHLTRPGLGNQTPA